MVIGFGANIAALRAVRQLDTTQHSLGKVYERLASGSRIAGASDDAASLAIATSLNTQEKLYGQAIRNIGDGISMVQIASSALESQSLLLQRLSELAEQSANGVYSSTQRKALNSEYQALVREYTRIGQSTSFNGVAPLAGRSADYLVTIQAGTDGSNNSSIQIAFGSSVEFSGILNVRPDLTNDGLSNIDDLGIWAQKTLVGSSFTSTEVLQFFDGQLGTISVTDSTGNQRLLQFGITGINSANFRLYVLEEQGDGTYLTVGLSSAIGFNTATGQLTGATTITTDANGSLPALSFDMSGLRLFNSQIYDQAYNSALPSTTGIAFTNVLTAESSLVAIDILARKRTENSAQSGNLGAYIARLEVSAQLANTFQTAFKAAASRITDVDVAAESANLLRLTILQNATAALFAQANQQPALAMRLLA